MTTVEILAQRNADFAAHRFSRGLHLMPSLKTLILGCADPRVDPAQIFGLDLGDAVVVRNLGGRVNPGTLQTLSLLGMIGRAMGGVPGDDWNLVVLHHTDCGITRLAGFPDQLADHLGIPADELDAKAVDDPWTSVAVDVALLKRTPSMPPDMVVSGFVYDVATGLVEQVVAPAPLRER